MDEKSFERWEARLQEAARQFPYPHTPDIAAAVAPRRAGRRGRFSPLRSRLAWAAAAVLLVFLATVLAVPSARAAVLEFIQIGVVRIFQAAPAPTSMPPLTATPRFPAGETPPPAAASRPAPPDLALSLDVFGETSLADARARAGFEIRLPAYPPDLGQPDHVYLQDMQGAFLALVWMLPGQPDKVRLSLHTIAPGSFAIEKVQPRLVQSTAVNGQPAAWTEGPYVLRIRNGDLDIRRMIAGHVLIWEEGGLTYRLETDLPLEEAVRIAESLQ